MSNSFYAGIASQFKPEEKFIHEYDPTVITFFAKQILLGSRAIHSNLPQPKAGDIIRFQFQPERKKLVIHLVRHSLCHIERIHQFTHEFRTDNTRLIYKTASTIMLLFKSMMFSWFEMNHFI